jgi:acyl carrier protein
VTRDDIIAVVREELVRLAPDSNPAGLSPTSDLREALDLDSMDFLNLMVALGSRLGVEVPEADYGKVATMAALTDYLLGAGAQPTAAPGQRG